MSKPNDLTTNGTERSGPPTPRGDDEPTPLWKLALMRDAEERKGGLASMLAELEGAPAEECDRRADLHYGRASELQRQLCRAPVESERDLWAALDLVNSYFDTCGSHTDEREALLVSSVRNYLRKREREREKAARPNLLKPVLTAGQAVDIMDTLKAVVQGLSVAIRALEGCEPSPDARHGAVQILRAELARASGLERRFLDVLQSRGGVSLETAVDG